MEKLKSEFRILALLLCAALGASGAVGTVPTSGSGSPFGPIVGTGGITVSSNGISGQYTVDGTGISGPTNGVSATVVTSIVNTLIYSTNECFTTPLLNTNIMLATGFGTAGANGTYNWNGTSRFTNGVNVLYFDSGYGAWIISNSVSGVLYDSFLEPSLGGTQNWDDIVGGVGPLGVTTYGPITNCFTRQGTVYPLNFAAVNTNLYVEVTGNNTNAARGRLDRPWKTVSAALLAATRGDRVMVGAGFFPETDGVTMILTNRCFIVGQGPGVTVIGTAGGSEDSLFLCSDTAAENFTFHGKLVFGSGQQFLAGASSFETTNALIRSVYINGEADGIGFDTWQNVFVDNVFINDQYDGPANWDNRGVSQTAFFRNVHVVSAKSSGAFETIHGVSWLAGNLIWDGGSLTASNGQVQNACIYIPPSTNAAAMMVFNGVRMTHFATNFAVSSVVLNSNLAKVLIMGTAPVEVQPRLINSLVTNQYSDHIVGITNATTGLTGGRTNKLVDTLGFGTNGFLAGKYSVTIYDRTRTASGTNIYIHTVGNQKLNGGPTVTNISVDGGSFTFSIGGIGGTNWVMTSGGSGGGSGGNVSSNNAGGITAIGLSTNLANVYNEGTIVQTAGGVAADFQGAFLLRGGNIIDALSQNRLAIPSPLMGPTFAAQFYGTNGGNVALTIDKDGNGVTASNLTINGGGPGGLSIYDNAQAEYSRFEAPFDIQTNNVNRSFSNATAGVVVRRGAGTGTNQLDSVPHAAGMFTNDGAGVFGWMTIPSGGSGSPGGASGAVQFNQGGAFDGTNVFTYDRTNKTLSGVVNYKLSSSLIHFFPSDTESFQVGVTFIRPPATNSVDLGTDLLSWGDAFVQGLSIKGGGGTAPAAGKVWFAKSGSGVGGWSNLLSYTTSQQVLGTLTGPTNYVFVLSTNSSAVNANVFYCGSNTVNIVVSNTAPSTIPIPFTIIVTNRTATPYALGFVEAGTVTNNHLFMGVYGQARPTTSTNATTTLFAGLADGTNITWGYSTTGIFPP